MPLWFLFDFAYAKEGVAVLRIKIPQTKQVKNFFIGVRKKIDKCLLGFTVLCSDWFVKRLP